MPLYACPGCNKPISESQPLEHCLNCEAMNERQNVRNRERAASVSDDGVVVECTVVKIIFRRPSQQYGPGSAPPPPYDEPYYEPGMTFPFENETAAAPSGRNAAAGNAAAGRTGTGNRETGSAATSSSSASSTALPIRIQRK